MKYMHFKASCSYAALANMLESRGIDTEDYKIALEMKLPFMFAKDMDGFISGPMLQSSEWFNLWLVPHGLVMKETRVDRNSICQFLHVTEDAMLGITTPYGKHAVVYRGYDGGFIFLNPIREGDSSSSMLNYDEAALLENLDDEVMIATIHAAEKQDVQLRPLLEQSVSVLRQNIESIIAYSAEEHAPEDYMKSLNSLFRPLLLDGISMLELLQEHDLATLFIELQGALMQFMRGDRTGILNNTLDTAKLEAAAKQYESLILQEIRKEQTD